MYYSTFNLNNQAFFNTIHIFMHNHGYLHFRFAQFIKKIKKPSPFGNGFWMRMSGLEPMTPCMSSRYSNQLSYTLTTESIISYVFGFVNPYFGFF